MFTIIQESALPKLSQTSMFVKFNESSNLSKIIVDTLKRANQIRVKPEQIPEIISLIKLNGDPVAKKAINAVENGSIIILNDKETSQIPNTLPYIITGKEGKLSAYVFAERVVDNINSSNEYIKLMAVIEAAYLALQISNTPNKFINNRPLMLTFCNLYVDMVTAPVEQKLYVKGENLTKMRLYAIAYFYKMIDGDTFDIESLPSIAKRVVLDKVDNKVVKQIGEEVKQMESLDFMNLLEKFTQVNPVRYKDLSAMYMSYFIQVCGAPIIFATENLPYLFLLMSSAQYKTSLTGYALNKSVSMIARKASKMLTT